MKIYFVRHGETDHNAKRIHQPVTAELSEHGITQAESLAKRFANIPIETIIASPYVRTKHTAEIISQNFKKELVLDDRIREVKKPSEVEDKKYDDPTAAYIKQLCLENFTNPDWRHSDEENFSDIALRTQSFVESLTTRQEKNILVVTHGTILKLIVLQMVLPQYASPQVYLSLNTALHMINTGITVCEWQDNKSWRLVTWNDHAHLG